jgi:prepilin-type N-terminal cleavage/methylation domain-containing protein
MKKAFTLIELLVVIAIIAILAAILFPVFAQAKMAAKTTQALSNVKQLATGYTLYIQDYDGTYYEMMQGWTGASVNRASSLIWNGYINPYTKSALLAIDPAATQPVTSYQGKTFTGLTANSIDYYQLSIGYNWELTSSFGYACSQEYVPPFSSCGVFYNESSFPYSSQQLLFAATQPGAAATQGSTIAGGYVAYPLDAPNKHYGSISDIHNGFTPVSFIDGHAKTLKATTLLVRDQLFDTNPNTDGKCVNYDSAHVYWDPSAPNPNDISQCEGLGIR